MAFPPLTERVQRKPCARAVIHVLVEVGRPYDVSHLPYDVRTFLFSHSCGV